MICMGIDTAGKSAGVAITQNGRLLVELTRSTGLTHSETLLPMVDQALREAGLELGQVELFGVNAGPGSFTGLRIGLAAVKGLALPRQTPCAAVSTLEALAAAFPGGGTVVPTLDARRGQVYWAAFDQATGARLQPDGADSAESLRGFLENCKKPFFFVGDGAGLCYNVYKDFPGLVPSRAPLCQNRAASVCCVAQEMALRGESVCPAALLPSYHRLSQAERELQERERMKVF